MAANEPAGAAADETNEGEIICLDIPAGWAHHRPSTPQLVTASQTPYGWLENHFVNPYRMCRCRARRGAAAGASGRLESGVGRGHVKVCESARQGD